MEEMARTQSDVRGLKEKVRELEMMKSDEERTVREQEHELDELKEDILEAKMHRIAMEEITNCSREDMLRTLGYVESFHGYPDKVVEKEKKGSGRDSK